MIGSRNQIDMHIAWNQVTGAKRILHTKITADIWIYSLSFVVVFVGVPSAVPNRDLVHYFLLVIIGAFLCLRIRIILSVQTHVIYYWLWYLLMGVVVFSSFLTRNAYETRDPFSAAIVYFGGLLEFVLVVQYAVAKKRLDEFLDTSYWVGMLFLFATDLLIFLQKSDGNYLIGNKFSVAYFHILIIAFAISRASRKNQMQCVRTQFILTLLVTLSFASAIRVNCMTGVAGLILMLLWLGIGKLSPLFVRNPITVGITLLFSYAFIYISTSLLKISIVSQIITNTLNHDITLSGRTAIFPIIPIVLRRRPWLGYGYGISYEVLSIQGVGFVPDAQNGLAEWMIYGGLFAGLALVALVTYIFYSAYRLRPVCHLADIFIAVVYSFICMATVEITFDTVFFAVLSIIYAFEEESSVQSQWCTARSKNE